MAYLVSDIVNEEHIRQKTTQSNSTAKTDRVDRHSTPKRMARVT